MSGRILVAGLLLSLTASVLRGQDRFDAEMVRSALDQQFSDLDSNDDEQLDENEVNGIPGPTLEMLRTHGLGEAFPISRSGFVTAGVALAAAQAGETEPPKASKPEEDRPRPPVVMQTETTAPPARNGTRKNRYVLDLPPEYATRDKNGDGQIGLYEWDRKKYAEFAKLDKNGDGFLTPAELVSKETLKAIYSRTAKDGSESGKVAATGAAASGSAPPTVPPNGSAPAGTATAAPGAAPPAKTSSTGTASGGADSVEAEARGAFARIDDNKDGEVVETEWMKSRGTRQMFETAGTKVTFPIKVEAFIGLYRTARAAGRRG